MSMIMRQCYTFAHNCVLLAEHLEFENNRVKGQLPAALYSLTNLGTYQPLVFSYCVTQMARVSLILVPLYHSLTVVGTQCVSFRAF